MLSILNDPSNLKSDHNSAQLLNNEEGNQFWSAIREIVSYSLYVSGTINLIEKYFSIQLGRIVNDEVQYQKILKAKCETFDLLSSLVFKEEQKFCHEQLTQRADLTNNKIFNKVKIKELKKNGNLASKEQHGSENPVIQSLLKSVYSKIDTDENLGNIFDTLYNKHPILQQVLNIASQYPLTPIYIVNDIKQDFDFESNGAGYYSLTSDLVVASNCNQYNNCQGTIIHELSHMIIYKTFNNMAQPFYAGKASGKAEYEQAAFETVKNIAGNLGLKQEEYISFADHISLGKNLWNNHCSFKNSSHKNCNYGYTKILACYMEEFYNNTRVHNAELIVRLPQLLAYYDDFDNEVIHAMKPLQDYWEQHITPEFYAA